MAPTPVCRPRSLEKGEREASDLQLQIVGHADTAVVLGLVTYGPGPRLVS
jgi:hypothetical protein